MTAIAMDAEVFEDETAGPSGRSRLLRFLIGSAALCAAAAAVWAFFQMTGARPVARLLIEGELRRVSAAEIDAAVRPLLDARFVDVDLDAVHQAVQSLPWVARVRVEREWPATVRLRLWERMPAARWGTDGLLDGDAVIFAPQGREVPESLPELSGPEGSAPRVLATYRRLSARLDGSPFALLSLGEDARGDWTGTTRDGVVLRFGRDDPLTAVDVLLGPAAQALAARMDAVKYVDLRYTNGFSVGWRELPADAKRN
ncbi:cell division protein FtsQ/DivIB [Fontimonas sp. SYSU GA230001]|uniref:cell division protein FtsQ/DivIB n=1 Tax=Fontimonas sp. SYSU GA230001 TaxID=3142450 RepID=UPI0032B5090B